MSLGIIASILFPYYSVTPGVLIEGHTALKNDCFSCHTIGKGSQNNKCIVCHSADKIGKTTVAGIPLTAERDKSILIHSSVQAMECFYCHTEHNGRSKQSANAAFSHSILDQQKQGQCGVCHPAPTTYVHTFTAIQCSECHSTSAWKTGKFNHSLLGAKVQQCTDCHVRNIPVDDLHKSVSSKQQCSACHSTTAWKPSTYDHAKLFRFDNNHPAKCGDCHSPAGGFKTYSCYTCHEHSEGKIASKHQQEGIPNFSNCVKCHRSGNEHEIIGREGGNGENQNGERSNADENKKRDEKQDED